MQHDIEFRGQGFDPIHEARIPAPEPEFTITPTAYHGPFAPLAIGYWPHRLQMLAWCGLCSRYVVDSVGAV